MALGALPSDVRRLVLSQALFPVAFGLVAGLAISLGLTRFLASFLYEIKATDPATFAAALVLFLGAACLAALLPARRAARIDPMVTLRYE
jgi:putative ABC transport system permease protein